MLFPKLLNMSLTASVAILCVLLLRLLLNRAPKVISYALWSIVLFRLLCPVSISSSFSLFGWMDAPTEAQGALSSRITYVPEASSTAVSEPTIEAQPEAAVTQGLAPMEIAAYVWLMGVLGMAGYGLISYVRLRRRLRTASPLGKRIYRADEIPSAFVLGLFRPKIYLPSALTEAEQTYILLHERQHIRRGDHILKALAFLALCLHWFNPLVWVAFVQAGLDMEMSCDEAVVKKLGEGVLADYTASLLSLATGRRIGMPLAFGEGDPKGRIRNLAKWKKPTLWVILAALVLCIILALMLLTNPRTVDDDLSAFLRQEIFLANESHESDTMLLTADCEVLRLKQTGDSITVYAWVLYQEYSYDGELHIESGSHIPTVITAKQTSEGYALEEYWEPRDGAYFAPDIREKFPFYLWLSALDSQRTIERQVKECERQAWELVREQSLSSTPGVQWTYSPMMSATWHGFFYFQFDPALEYTHVVAACDNGSLQGLHALELGQPSRQKSTSPSIRETKPWIPAPCIFSAAASKRARASTKHG